MQQVELYDIYQKKESKIVMLGDSITYGINWSELFNGLNIINRGINSDTTKGFIERLDLIYKLNPKYVFIMGGINDILKGYKIDDIFNNYKTVIERLKARDITPVVQSTLFISKHVDNKKVKKLNSLLTIYCKNNKIDFIDLNKELSENDILINKYTYDGIHLKSNGYKIWRNNLKKYFVKNM
jgi:lysophospholipase L1-like esterase